VCNILIRVEIENCGKKVKVESSWLGKEVAWETYGAFPEFIWNSGEGWEKAVHMPSCVTYVVEEHLVFVKWALTYLTMDVVRWGGEGASGKGGGNRGDRRLGKARVRLK